MMILQYITWALAGVCLLALICRLDGLSWRTHQASVVSMHIGMALLCVAAFLAPVSIGELGGIVATASWLWVSLPTWAAGPPQHTETRPGELAVLEALFDRGRS